MESDNVMSLQNQIRENSEELQKYLLDLECWEKEMKRREEESKLIRSPSEEEIPPVRNLLYRSKKKNRHKKQKDKNTVNKVQISENGDQTSENGDENEMKEVSVEEEQMDELAENSDHEEELEGLRKKQLAYLHKEKGNEFFKQGNYESAINSYTTGIYLDPENPLLPANRAMAFLKKEQFQAAENDCTLCLSLDPTYVKAYLRRGSARKKLNKFSLAKADFTRVLDLEPENKQAKSELKQIAEKCKNEETGSIPEGEVVKMQKLWSKFLGRESVTQSEENMETGQSSDLTNVENKCIFSDSSPVMPLKSSPSRMNMNPEMEIDIKEMEEENFVGIVEDNAKKVKEYLASKAETLIDESKIKPQLPPAPSTSFQFLTDWNVILNYPDLRHEYLKQFNPEKLPVVFKHYMEPEIFSTILETLCTSFLQHGEDVFDYMKNLANVGRFNTMIMFLSDKEEKDLNKLLDCIKTSGRSESEISEVVQKYRA